MPHQHGHGPAQQGPQPLPGVDAIIAVGSGKGGVGKTTLSVNLAVALAKMGHKVGLLDADVYGPNVPLMLGTNAQPRMVGENRIEPIEAFGLKVISVGFLNPGSAELNTSLLAAFRKGLAGPLHRGQECRDRIPTCRRRDHTTGDAATA